MADSPNPDSPARFVDADLLKLSYPDGRPMVADVVSNLPSLVNAPIMTPSEAPPSPTVTLDIDKLSGLLLEASHFVGDNEEFLTGLTLGDQLQAFYLCMCIGNCTRLVELLDEYLLHKSGGPQTCYPVEEVMMQLSALIPLFAEYTGEFIKIDTINKAVSAVINA